VPFIGATRVQSGINMDRRVIIAAMVLAAAAAAAYYWWGLNAQKSEPGITAGDQALDIEVEGVQETRFVLSDQRGEVIVLEFMTMWCRFCGISMRF